MKIVDIPNKATYELLLLEHLDSMPSEILQAKPTNLMIGGLYPNGAVKMVMLAGTTVPELIGMLEVMKNELLLSSMED